MLPVIILGTGMDALAASDIIQLNDIVLYSFFTADSKILAPAEIHEISVLGSVSDSVFTKLVKTEEKVEVVIAENDIKTRKHLADTLKNSSGRISVNCIHAQAHISARAVLGHGNLIQAGCLISSDVQIGDMNNLSAGVILEAGSKIGKFNTLGSGVIICSGAIIEDEVSIGAGSIIGADIVIQSGAIIQPGSVVLKSVNRNKKAGGNPAEIMKS